MISDVQILADSASPLENFLNRQNKSELRNHSIFFYLKNR